jgi:clan AA aspartic protease
VLTGTVNSSYEAVVRLRVRGPNGRDLEAEAIIDTGFTGSLTLPRDVVNRLDLRFQGHERGVLADGSEGFFEIYEALVLWNGRFRPVSVDVVDTTPLLGMSLLRGSELAIQVVEGGEVVIQELPAS